MFSRYSLSSFEMTWRSENHFYRTLGHYFREEFGEPVRKISVDARFGCPHKNSGGCVFCCEESFSPAREQGLNLISEQIREGVRRMENTTKKVMVRKFIAYFQPGTNTFATVERLEKVYREALASSEIVGIAIGTRPDCLADEVLDLLQRLCEETWLSLEIGLQSIHDRSLRFFNRGHDFQTFDTAVEKITARKIRWGVHLILGIPGEDHDDRLATARKIAQYKPHSIKLHNLYVARNTKLAQMWCRGEVPLPTSAEYAQYVVDFLEWQHPQSVIERISAQTKPEYLLAPSWSTEKHTVRNAVDREFRKRQSFQGKHFMRREAGGGRPEGR